MKTFLIGFSVVLFLGGVLKLVNPEQDGGKFGRQESYQSIPAGIMMIGVSAIALYAGKPLRTLKLPKNEKEKRERMKWVTGATYGFIIFSVSLSIIEPGWGNPPRLRDLEEIIMGIPSALALSLFLYLIAAPLCYLSTETN